jgi:hypothetical protein
LLAAAVAGAAAGGGAATTATTAAVLRGGRIMELVYKLIEKRWQEGATTLACPHMCHCRCRVHCSSCYW